MRPSGNSETAVAPERVRYSTCKRCRTIPKGFHRSAQGWSPWRTTLGHGAESLFPTLKALHHRPPEDATLSEWLLDWSRAPRVAAAPQPWAEGLNPFGIRATCQAIICTLSTLFPR
jgi:hypothetical protein